MLCPPTPMDSHQDLKDRRQKSQWASVSWKTQAISVNYLYFLIILKSDLFLPFLAFFFKPRRTHLWSFIIFISDPRTERKKKWRWKENLNLNMIRFCLPNMLKTIICQSRYCVLSRFSCVWFFVTPWTLTCQAPLFMGFSKQEYWNGLLCPPPGDLPNPGMEPVSHMSLALAGRFFITNATWETLSVQVRAGKRVRTMPNLLLNSQIWVLAVPKIGNNLGLRKN